MSIRISSITDGGDLEKERVVMRVSASADIGEYALLRTPFKNGSVTTGVTNTFWFPDQEVGKGDLVVLYTKSGHTRIKTNENGTKTHFFYWDLRSPLWGTSHYAPVLLQVESWESYTSHAE